MTADRGRPTNREAMARMRAEVKLEPGTLEVVARLARDWFTRHLLRQRSAA